MLMGKLCYVEGDYSEALTHFNQVNFDEMQLSSAPIYRLAMIAEAYATKGERTRAHTHGHRFYDVMVMNYVVGV